MKRKKTLRSYAAHARFLAECGDKTMWMARKHCPVNERYRSGPSVAVMEWNGQWVWIAEPAHKTYEVWIIPVEKLHATEADANREQLGGRP